ncbi:MULTISPECIES: MFS transporter [unclassified Ensifer]|uniref:MFS transporter n=1 Tax=unclassified Ensifer TaxID=2633371 RepID=UPI001112C524|nr:MULTISPECIES: MFS transporter [unclassified Ensifer]
MIISIFSGCAAFRRICLVLAIQSFCSWMLVAALPIIVAARFGAGAELIGSLALRLLPRILFAPLAAALIRKAGPRVPVLCAIAGVATAIPAVTLAPNAVTVQAIILLIGLADTVIAPGLLTLRSASVPPGRNMEANTAFQAIDRFAKIFGPPAAGLAAAMASISATLLVLALGHLIAATLLVPRPPGSSDPREPTVSPTRNTWREAFAIMRGNPLLWALLIPAFGYMVSLGALQPFLLWLNRDQFHLGPEMWTMLLGAQGAGALLGVFVSNCIAKTLIDTRTLLLAYLFASLLEGISTFMLIFAPSHGAAMALLIVGGVPEMIAFATYFTLVQRCLCLERQVLFYALSLPLMDLGLMIGVLSGAMHASGPMTLGQFWLFACACTVLPVLPFLKWRKRAGRHRAAAQDQKHQRQP